MSDVAGILDAADRLLQVDGRPITDDERSGLSDWLAQEEPGGWAQGKSFEDVARQLVRDIRAAAV